MNNLQKETLTRLLGHNNVLLSPEEMNKHGQSDFYLNKKPEMVCYPESEEDIQKIMDYCFEECIPLIPYGGGTGVEGHTAAIHGGICVDLSRMKKIIEVNIVAGYVLVEPGITFHELNEYLFPLGYHFGVEAGWGATIGGMAATNASGAGALDVGSMRDNVRYCEAMIYLNGKSERLKAGSFASKTSADLSFKHLLIGSEGILGIITKIAVNIRKNFTQSYTIFCQPNAIEPVIECYAKLKDQIHFRRVEWMDALQVSACLAYAEENFFLQNNQNLLMIELGGEKEIVLYEKNLLMAKLAELSLHPVQIFSDEVSARPLWMMRKKAGTAAIHYFGQGVKKGKTTDVAVPLDVLALCMKECYEYMNQLGIQAPCIAHLGQANFHFKLLVDPDDLDDVNKMQNFDAFVTRTALKYRGTCTGEHGIGMGCKLKFLEQEFGESYLILAQQVKKLMDPHHILNPGKKLK